MLFANVTRVNPGELTLQELRGFAQKFRLAFQDYRAGGVIVLSFINRHGNQRVLFQVFHLAGGRKSADPQGAAVPGKPNRDNGPGERRAGL